MSDDNKIMLAVPPRAYCTCGKEFKLMFSPIPTIKVYACRCGKILDVTNLGEFCEDMDKVYTAIEQMLDKRAQEAGHRI